MKRLRFAFYITIGLIFLQTSVSQAKNFERQGVTLSNINTVLLDIREYYITNPTFQGGGVAPVDQAMDSITYLMARLFETNISSSCRQGQILDMRAVPDLLTNGYKFEIDWDQSGNGHTYLGVALDLVSLLRNIDIKSTANISIRLPNYVDKKFYVFNSICTDGQSSFSIIIIEKDMDFDNSTFNDFITGEGGEEEGEEIEDLSGQVTPRAGATSATQVLQTKLSVYPNPVMNTATSTLAFSIPALQTVSVSLIEASSGKQAKVFFADRLFRPGDYQESILLDRLAPGVYYLVLQTGEDLLVERLLLLAGR